jgi:predicted ribosomally synthesized peptide with SipW-like signal peptide
MRERWVAFGVACLVVATAAFGAGAGTVALFSDTETISGSFSVADEQDSPFGPWSENGTVNDSHGDADNGSDAGTPGNGTAPPNGTNGGNGTTGGNGSAPNGTTGGNGSAPNGTVGGNGTAGGNASDDSTGDDGNDSGGHVGEASVAVTSVDLTTSEVVVGEASGVLVTVQNEGNASASFTATLTVDGSETTSGTIDLAPGEQSTLSLQHTFQSSGNYTLRGAGIVAGTVAVVDPSPDLSVANADVGSAAVAPNETVTATATVTNDGTASGTTEVALAVDGAVVGTTSVTVAPGGSETVSFDHSFSGEGTYTLAVGGVSAGTVEVVGSSGNETSQTG